MSHYRCTGLQLKCGNSYEPLESHEAHRVMVAHTWAGCQLSSPGWLGLGAGAAGRGGLAAMF